MIRLTVPRIALVFAAVILFALAVRPLLAVDETRYLDVAWEMRLSGDYLHLTRNFESYSHKPPLLFWLINFIWLPGLNEFTARLVAPAFGVAAIFGTGALARRLSSGQVGTGIRSAAVLAGFCVYTLYASMTMFDTMLTCATLLGMAAIWNIGTTSSSGAGRRQDPNWKSWLVLGAAMAFGAYAKGPVILVHLVPPLLLMRFWAPRPPSLGRAATGFVVALAIALFVVALWLVPSLLRGDAAFRHELLWTQSAGRVAGGFAHDRPVWFLLALMPVFLFPWAWSYRLWRGVVLSWKSEPAIRFCGIWALSGLILFSFISGKQIHYLIPEMPAVAIMFGFLLSQPGRVGRGYFFAPMALLLLALLLVLVALGWVHASGLPPEASPRVLIGFAILIAVLALASLRLPFLPGHLGLGLGIVLALHIMLLVTGAGARFDSHVLAGRLESGREGGLANFGMRYSAEVNWAMLLTEPVANPRSAEDVRAWAEAHPEGLLFGPVGRVPVTAPPEDQVDYNGETLGIWKGTTAAASIGG